MVKGLSHLGANFRLIAECLRFLASNQTLSLSLNGEKELWVRAAMTWWASSCVTKALSRAVERAFRRVSTAGIEVLEITKGRARGSYPIMR